MLLQGLLKRRMCQLADLSPWMKPQTNSLLSPHPPPCLLLWPSVPPFHCQPLFKWLIFEWIQKLQIIKDTQIIGLVSKLSVPWTAARFLLNEYIHWQRDVELAHIREKMSSPALQQLAAQGKQWQPLQKFSLNVVFFPINDTLRIQLRVISFLFHAWPVCENNTSCHCKSVVLSGKCECLIFGLIKN